MTTRIQQQPVVHSTFVVERTYDASPQRVFAAFATPALKRRWFAEGENWEVLSFDMDFRVGGLEKSRFRFKNGPDRGNASRVTPPGARSAIR